MTHTVLAFGAVKTAALYFDTVVPLPGLGLSELSPLPDGSLETAMMRAGSPEAREAHEAEESLFPVEKFGTPGDRRPAYHELQRAGNEFHMAVARAVAVRRLADAGLEHELPGGALTVDGALRRLLEICSGVGLSGCPIVTPGSWSSSESSGAPIDGMIAISSLQLVDAPRVGWDEIMAVRSDPDAWTRLRRLRAFAQANYAGKPRAFVEDDLLSRIDDYERTVREWKFETILSSLSVMLSGQAMASATATGLATALFGAPGLGAIASAAAVEVGHVLVAAGRARLDHRRLRESHPVAYLVEARGLQT